MPWVRPTIGQRQFGRSVVTAFELPGVPPVTQRAVTGTTLALLAVAGVDTHGGPVGDWFVFSTAPDPDALDGAWREACARHGVAS